MECNGLNMKQIYLPSLKPKHSLIYAGITPSFTLQKASRKPIALRKIYIVYIFVATAVRFKSERQPFS